jgi:hypothetical protein
MRREQHRSACAVLASRRTSYASMHNALRWQSLSVTTRGGEALCMPVYDERP